MKKINQSELLDQMIEELRKKRDSELIDLKNQYQQFVQSAKPSNIIKQSISEVYNSSIDKETIINAFTGFVGGYISKKLFVGKSDNSLKEILGNVLQYSISTLINKFYEKK